MPAEFKINDINRVGDRIGYKPCKIHKYQVNDYNRR